MIKILDTLLKNFNGKVPEEKIQEIFEHLYKQYPTGQDAWGLNLEKAKSTLRMVWPLYQDYFKVRVFGKENVKDTPYMIISNHSGQIAIDGMLIATAFSTEIDPPRILRSMAERFFVSLPYIGMWGAEGGVVLGDRQNCLNLLEQGESVLAFPEGVNGVAKSTNDFYKLQNFTRGFFRMSLSAGVNILPLGVVGAEEIFPWVYQAKGLAKKMGLPALPLSPLYFPLPSPIDIYIGKPYIIPKDLSPDASDSKVDEHIEIIKDQIHMLIQNGLTQRRDFWAKKKDDNREG